MIRKYGVRACSYVTLVFAAVLAGASAAQLGIIAAGGQDPVAQQVAVLLAGVANLFLVWSLVRLLRTYRSLLKSLLRQPVRPSAENARIPRQPTH